MRHEQRINVPGHASGVIGKGHRCAADDEHICNHTTPDQSVTQGSERPL